MAYSTISLIKQQKFFDKNIICFIFLFHKFLNQITIFSLEKLIRKNELDEPVVHYIRDAVHRRFLASFVEENPLNSSKVEVEGQPQFELEASDDHMSKIIRLRQNFCSSGVRTAVLAAQFSFLLSASKAIGDFNYAKEKVENYEKKIFLWKFNFI